jgi:hypothetical protein
LGFFKTVQITNCDIILSVCILQCTNTRATGLRGYIPQLLKYQDFWSISSMLNKLYSISEAH